MFLQISPEANTILMVLQSFGLPTLAIFFVTLYLNVSKAKTEVENHNKRIEKLEGELTNFKTDFKEIFHNIEKTLLEIQYEIKNLKTKTPRQQNENI
jgi:uncharacterized protein (UPF0335 family)